MGKTLVLGASMRKERFSYLAMKSLYEHKIEFIAIGAIEGEAFGTKIKKGKPKLDNIDTVTLYLNPTRQKEYYEYILALKPHRIIFNPGTENGELFKILRETGIEIVIGCTLVMLHNNTF